MMTAALVFAASYLVIGAAFTALCSWLDYAGGGPIMLPTAMHHAALMVLGPLAFFMVLGMVVCLPFAWLIQLATKAFVKKPATHKLDDLVEEALEKFHDDPRTRPN